MQISNTQELPQYSQPLLALFATHWPDMTSLGPGLSESCRVIVPAPLLILDSAGELLGGLAFSRFAHPERDGLALWINAVAVKESYKRRGLASKLVVAAQSTANEAGASALFALTNFPQLYLKLGWNEQKQHADGTVVSLLW